MVRESIVAGRESTGLLVTGKQTPKSESQDDMVPEIPEVPEVPGH
jgi:hypothetical protein